MNCEGCTAYINSVFLKVRKVIEANTSYKIANAIVKFENSRISVDSIANTVNEIGYKVTSIINNK